MGQQVKVAGVWLDTIATVADLQTSTTWPGGCAEASWAMDLGPDNTPPALARGALVEIMDGLTRTWVGLLSEPDRGDGWTLNARGLASEAVSYLCIDSNGNPTSIPDTAIDRAILRGLPWTRPASVSNVRFSVADTTTNLNRLDLLLNAYAESVGKQWAVFADGAVQVAANPTVPTWVLSPGAGVMGVADDDYVSVIYARYVTAVAGTPPAPSAWATTVVADPNAVGRRERALDLTPLGVMTQSRATSLAQARLDQGKARRGWTNGLEAAATDLWTLGGIPARLCRVKAGDMLRIHGVLDAQGNLDVGVSIDVVLGEVKYTDGADTITLNPVGLVDRDLESVLATPAVPEEAFAG